jgi:hypothetical protein
MIWSWRWWRAIAAVYRASGLQLAAAAAGVVGAEDVVQEAPPGYGQARGDRRGLAGRVDPGRVTDRDPPGRDPGVWRHDRADVDHRAESGGGGAAQVRAGQRHRARRQEHLIADGGAGELGVRADQHPVTDGLFASSSA